MKQIEAETHRLHAESTAESIPAPSSSSTTTTDDKKAPPMLIPFAKLDEVQDSSPAMLAGICNDDLLISFGTVDISTAKGNPMGAIPSEVTKNTNKVMEVVVLRGTTIHSLSLTPCPWTGRGLIGCHLTPL